MNPEPNNAEKSLLLHLNDGHWVHESSFGNWRVTCGDGRAHSVATSTVESCGRAGWIVCRRDLGDSAMLTAQGQQVCDDLLDPTPIEPIEGRVCK